MRQKEEKVATSHLGPDTSLIIPYHARKHLHRDPRGMARIRSQIRRREALGKHAWSLVPAIPHADSERHFSRGVLTKKKVCIKPFLST